MATLTYNQKVGFQQRTHSVILKIKYKVHLIPNTGQQKQLRLTRVMRRFWLLGFIILLLSQS